MDVDSGAEEEQATHLRERQRPQPARQRKHDTAAVPGSGAVAQGAEEGGATHSNSGVPDVGGSGFHDGLGMSSRDEAQV